MAQPALISLALKRAKIRVYPKIRVSKHKRCYSADFEDVSCQERQLSGWDLRQRPGAQRSHPQSQQQNTLGPRFYNQGELGRGSGAAAGSTAQLPP